MLKSQVERMLVKQSTEQKIPVYGIVELLPLCNMNCDMCYVRLSRAEMEQQGRLRTGDEWLAMAREMREAGVLFLLLTGGEPFLYPEFRRLYQELQELGMILTINSNGTLVTEELAAFLGQYKPRRVNITLYGSDEVSYRKLCHYPEGFEKTLNGIRLLKKYGVDVKVNGSLVKANREDVEKITAIAHSLDVPVKIDTYMYPASRERGRPFEQQARLNPHEAAKARVQFQKSNMTAERFRDFAMGMLYEAANTPPGLDQPGYVSCRAGRSHFVINWQGQMRPCIMLNSPSASVFEMGFARAWEKIVCETEQIVLSAKCSRCTLRQVCQTCAACALLETGSYEGVPDFMCRYTEETLKLLAVELEQMGVIKRVPAPDN